MAIARAAGVGADPIAGAVRDFHAVAHRLQTVRDEDGVLWINDSKATNVESAIAALRSFPGRSIVWIGGGKGAGTSIEPLAGEVAARSRHAVLNGASAGELDAALARRGYAERTVVATLDEAVIAAASIAQPGDVVLLAPGYKSFDQFRDFEDRGRAFGEAFRRLDTSVGKGLMAARAGKLGEGLAGRFRWRGGARVAGAFASADRAAAAAGVDGWLMIIVVGLVGFGLVMVYSASEALGFLWFHDPNYFFAHQLIGATLGVSAWWSPRSSTITGCPRSRARRCSSCWSCLSWS